MDFNHLYLRFLHNRRLARYAWFKWRMKNHFSFGDGCDIYTPVIRFHGQGRVVFDDGCIIEPGGFGVHFRVENRARVRFGPRSWIRTFYAPNVFNCGEAGATIEIGDDALFSGVFISAKKSVRIGEHFLAAFGSRIMDSDFHDIDENTTERTSPVRIGDYVWLGADVVVLRGVTIGSHTVIGTGSLVTSDIPDHCFAAGRPAKPIKTIGDRFNTR